MVYCGGDAAYRGVFRPCRFGEPLLYGSLSRPERRRGQSLRSVADGTVRRPDDYGGSGSRAVFLLLLGFGAIPRNFQLELFLLLTYGGWFLLWLVSLGYERAAKTRYLRLCHWALFLTVALLVLLGM